MVSIVPEGIDVLKNAIAHCPGGDETWIRIELIQRGSNGVRAEWSIVR